MQTLIVHANRTGPIRGRHPWVFSRAILRVPEGLASGDPVRLTAENGQFLASGYFNSYSQIAVRLWSWDEKETEIGVDFFTRRIRSALDIRERYVVSAATNAYRLINAENDELPGLIVDRYGEYLVVQCHTPVIAAWKNEITTALRAVLSPAGIYERSDVRERGSEKTAATAAFLYGDVPDTIHILENGHTFLVDVKSGQKTGFFLDQRDKRQALGKYSAGKKVLNCFSYSGGFSVYALAAGAERVVSVDASIPALEMAERNIAINNLDPAKAECIAAEVKDYLTGQSAGTFDIIILDPPAFVKDRRKVAEGLVGYRNINEQAMRLLPPGGILVTASCSAHVGMIEFRQMLSEAAGRAGRNARIVETYTHGIDHPQTAPFLEGNYLKCLFVYVL